MRVDSERTGWHMVTARHQLRLWKRKFPDHNLTS